MNRAPLYRLAVVIGCAALVGLSLRAARADEQTPLDVLFAQKRAEQMKATPRPTGSRRKRGERLRPSRIAGGPASAEVARLAGQFGVPRALALGVCKVESGCRYGLTGAAGEKGPLQIKPATARMLGYSGPASALLGSAGAYWGMKHLAAAWRGCGSIAGAAKRHNAGLGASCRANGYALKVQRLAGGV